jgi:hypothetical protein
MTKAIRLNDLQLVLLASAAARDNASLIPLPECCAQETTRIAKAVASLLSRGFVEEKPVTHRPLVWRTQEESMIGMFITQAGRDAIGASAAPDGNLARAVEEKETPPPHTGSKIGEVLSLLRRQEGATLAEMVEATGWLPHTTRAALTGLRKNGHEIAKGSRENTTCYRIAAEA